MHTTTKVQTSGLIFCRFPLVAPCWPPMSPGTMYKGKLAAGIDEDELSLSQGRGAKRKKSLMLYSHPAVAIVI